MQRKISVQSGDVRKKKIETDNHFVSHMIEHIAWRSGISIELSWPDSDYHALGRELAHELRRLAEPSTASCALGIIDDGSAMVTLTPGDIGVSFISRDATDISWFLSLRCEQLSSGAPLLSLLKGLAEGLNVRIEVDLWRVEDPHHSWEAIFRGVGIAINRWSLPENDALTVLRGDNEIVSYEAKGDMCILDSGCNFARARRGTAETGIEVRVDFLSPTGCDCNLAVDASISSCVAATSQFIEHIASALNCRIGVDFRATVLSSSHVVMEDIGIVLGRTLLEILKCRMARYGVNGAGDSVRFSGAAPSSRVAVSVEGRKFLRILPAAGLPDLFRAFLIGQDIADGMRSEDLDDFLDGLAAGLSASIMIHVLDVRSPSDVWLGIFRNVSLALAEAFLPNAARIGVVPGVKATLA